MARPIKETPILYGKDSDRFLEAVKQNEEDSSKRVSKEEYDRSKEMYNKVMENAKK